MAERVPLYLDFAEGKLIEVPSTDTIPASNVQMPIGYVYVTTLSKDPADDLGYGYWVLLGSQTIGSTTVYYYENSYAP